MRTGVQISHFETCFPQNRREDASQSKGYFSFFKLEDSFSHQAYHNWVIFSKSRAKLKAPHKLEPIIFVRPVSSYHQLADQAERVVWSR